MNEGVTKPPEELEGETSRVCGPPSPQRGGRHRNLSAEGKNGSTVEAIARLGASLLPPNDCARGRPCPFRDRARPVRGDRGLGRSLASQEALLALTAGQPK